ncbi:hypothetical protein GQ53DRAFT_664053 [Thozetella sp. PMI_491]|nr:hypothetical protein GQ53DRAFT_664053 [Thozetella sp. PMI_491]
MAQHTGTKQDAAQIPWNPNSTLLPLLDELPVIPGAPKDPAWVWGEDGNIGRLNLLTPSPVLAASMEIKNETIPAFNREPFVHHIKTLIPGLCLNTQSGTQWDGFRHFAHMGSGTFYNNTKGEAIVGAHSNQRCSIHHWAKHGIAGRGVLLDYRAYVDKLETHFDACDTCGISYQELYDCRKDQGIDIRPKAKGGDIEIGNIGSGWAQSYHSQIPAEQIDLALRGIKDLRFGSVAQEKAVLTWLRDCYFAAVAGDSPTFKA